MIRPDTKKIEEESIIEVHRIVNNMNCQYRTLAPDNAGIDGEIQLVNKTGKFEPFFLKCQLKAGESYISSENKEVVKVRLEKKYVELWNSMNVPVVLLFYHPRWKQVYWKSIKDFCKIYPELVKRPRQTVIIPFDKKKELFTKDILDALFSVAKGDYEYKKIKYDDIDKEIVYTNWLPVISFPNFVYKAPTQFSFKKEITPELKSFYAFIIKEKAIYTFSDLSYELIELRKFCNYDSVEKLNFATLNDLYLVELLNTTIYINMIKKGLVPSRYSQNRYFFSSDLLRDPTKNKFSFLGMKGGSEKRVLIYIRGHKNDIEYEHHAVQLSFQKVGNDWHLEIDPYMHYSYPPYMRKSIKEIGYRITKKRQKTFNKEYLYLLHFWKQFLSDNSNEINFHCDDTNVSQKIIIDTKGNQLVSNFTLFNDYFGEKVTK